MALRGAQSGGSRLAALLDLGCLAAQVAEVVELGATDVTAGHDLDGLEDRGVQREGALDADAEGDLADGERAADPRTVDADHDALEDLDTRAAALDDLHVDLDGVTGAEGRDVVALVDIADLGKDVGHVCSSRVPQVSRGFLGGDGFDWS